MSSNRIKLFCFPYAGGNADFYRELKQCIYNTDTQIEVIPLEYPGHGFRRKEELLYNFDELSEDMISQIINQLDGADYALMGYSMGSIVATEVLTKILKREDISKPEKVFLAAHAPKPFALLSALENCSEEEIIKEKTIAFGAIPESLVRNETFWRMYMPLYKADYGMIFNYDFEHIELKTDVDMVALYSQTDTPYETMLLWNNYYTGNNEYYMFEGNHFFIKEHLEEIGKIVVDRLCEVK